MSKQTVTGKESSHPEQPAGRGRPLMEIRGMTKTFGPVTALDRVDITVYAGEIRGLIGENGSGKSTVTSIMAGMQAADSGEMWFKGQPWHPHAMHDALRHGVGMIVQENGTVPGITVAENLFLCGTERFAAFGGRGGRYGLINAAAMRRAAQDALDEIGAGHIRADSPTGSLDMMDRKLCEVAKVWLEKPDIMIVDESTTALSQKGREIIYALMRRMAEDGRAVIFISHDLDEITAVCDTLTVLRDGHIIRTFDKAEFDDDLIRQSMIGRRLEGDYYRSDFDGSHGSEVVLSAMHISVDGQLYDVSLEAHKGEILGIGGLSPCGMHPLGKVLFGAMKPRTGQVLIHGQVLRDPATAIAHKAAYAAKDRDIESLCTEASIRDNIAITGLSVIGKAGFIPPGAERRYVQAQIDSMRIKCFSPDQPVSELSGGNKQKVVFGKWIGCGSEILILDCPTRGIDIGVKQTMYRLMYRMKQEGKTVIMISEELNELMGMSDRLLIMKNGRVAKEFKRDPNLSDAELIRWMV